MEDEAVGALCKVSEETGGKPHDLNAMKPIKCGEMNT